MKKLLKKVYQQYRQLTAGFRKTPDFLIIGAQKGGTSSLFYYLDQHPQVELSRIKEVHYFDNNFSKGLRWYRSFFPFSFTMANKITGEASPYYLFHPEVPERVYKTFPKIKLIALLRDPLGRAYSHYQMEIRKGREKIETFEEAINSEEKRIHDEGIAENPESNRKDFNHQFFSYLSRGRYYEQIQRWYQFFPASQILFIKSEDFFANPEKELTKVYAFLEIKNEIPPNLKPRNAGGNYPPVSPATSTFLQGYFTDSNQKLRELLGNNFTWQINSHK